MAIYPTTGNQMYTYPNYQWQHPQPKTETVVEETYEYDAQGRLLKKTVKKTTNTTQVTASYRTPYITYSSHTDHGNTAKLDTNVVTSDTSSSIKLP